VLKHCKVIIVGSQMPEIVQEAKMIPASTMDEAFEIIKNDLERNLEIILSRHLTQYPIVMIGSDLKCY